MDQLDRPGTDDTAGAALERLHTAQAVALVATLPREQAEAVMLRAVVGLDAVTAAQVLGKRPTAVRVASHRGLRRLAAALREQHVDGGDPFELPAASPAHPTTTSVDASARAAPSISAGQATSASACTPSSASTFAAIADAESA
jgi:RNA polymerase sigma-70 factor (ECF subfamily)